MGIAERNTGDINFEVCCEELNEKLKTLYTEVHALEEQIAET